ncbi:hypothetical protein [Desulfobacula toluolica]|nr:hypothetical protein [Desulfobacula toluolica]
MVSSVTQNDQGLILIDAGMDLDMIKQINSHGQEEYSWKPLQNLKH